MSQKKIGNDRESLEYLAMQVSAHYDNLGIKKLKEYISALDGYLREHKDEDGTEVYKHLRESYNSAIVILNSRVKNPHQSKNKPN